MEKQHKTVDLQRILEKAEKVGEVRMHLGLLVGEDQPSPWLPTEDFGSLVRSTGEALLTFSWDGDMGLDAKNEAGGVLKSFVLKF